MKTIPMFSTSDLPLFSGTTQKAQDERYRPIPTDIPPTLFRCPLCFDSGLVTTKHGRKPVKCTCGINSRKETK